MKNHFTVGIEDDVTGTSLPLGEQLDHRARRHRCAACSTALAPTAPLAPTRTASKSSATTPTCTRRAYFSYDSKKSGGLTVSHLRFGKTPDPEHLSHRRGRLCGLPQPQPTSPSTTCAQQGQGRRRVPAQQPLERPRRWTEQLPAKMKQAAGQEACAFLQHRRYRPGPERWAWATASTPSCRPLSSSWLR